MDIDHDFKDSEELDFQPPTYEPRILDSVLSAHDPSEQWSENRGLWGGSVGIDGGVNTTRRGYANVAAESESLVEHETLEKVWTWTVDTCSQIWEKLDPVVAGYIPEDRNPFWVCSVVVFVLFFAFAGLRADFTQGGTSKSIKKEAPKAVVNLPPINSPHIMLPDGRRIAYREQGVAKELARHTILVVHGFPSSRLAGIPGIKNRLLEDFGVRLIAYDRPGFGESDPQSWRSLRSSAHDMAHIADALGVEEFWVLGYATGGIHAWAAMKYIPNRLAGVGLFAPAGNFYASNMTKQESRQAWSSLAFHQKLLYRLARWVPSILPYICRRTFIRNVDELQNDFLITIGKDQLLMQQDMFVKALMRDIQESLRQTNVAMIAQELIVQVRPWGFHLSDLRVRKRPRKSGIVNRLKSLWKEEVEVWEGFSAPLHVWQGTEDRIVPMAMNEFAVRMVPQAVLHRLEGEGHFSYFWFCDKCHRNIFLTLFREPEGVKVPELEQPASGGLESYNQDILATDTKGLGHT